VVANESTILLVQYSDFISVLLIDLTAIVIILCLVAGLIYKFRFWIKVVPTGFFREANQHLGLRSLVSLFFSELMNRVLAEKGVLNDSRIRRATHLMVFWGFMGLAFATVWDDVFFHQGPLPAPLSFQNLGNIVGNVGGILLLAGMTAMILRYVFVSRFKVAKGDLSFLIVLYLATVSGFATEFARYSPTWFANSNYVVHLVIVAALILTAPFTHFFHAVLTPFLRYLERIQEALVNKKVVRYPYSRKKSMADLAVNIKDKSEEPTYPTWIDELRKKEDEK
jgi:nitrate reductase gamma subunit